LPTAAYIDLAIMPPPPLRIAFLECDIPLVSTQARYGSYGGVFTELLRAGADAEQQAGLSSTSGLVLSRFDVVHAQEYPSLEDIDAVLITGSRYNSFDDDDWILKLVSFTRYLLCEQQRVRVVGVCFGHQIVGRALGARVDRNPGGWEVSVVAVDLTKRGQELFGRPALVCSCPFCTRLFLIFFLYVFIDFTFLLPPLLSSLPLIPISNFRENALMAHTRIRETDTRDLVAGSPSNASRCSP
jgi:hypothetical protein